MDTEEKKAENKKKRINQEAQDREDIREVMSTEGGRRYINKLIVRAGIYKNSFTGQSNQTIFNEGGRNQGLQILAEVTTQAPGSYELMMKEKNND